MIEISTCRYAYDKEIIVSIDQLKIEEGEHLFLHGKSGSGKSTFLNLLCGVLSPSEGDIKVLGKSLTSMSSFERDAFRSDNYGNIFQHFNLLPYLSVEENIALPLGFSKTKREKVSNVKGEIKNLLKALELDVDLNAKALHLSVGQQQRVAVARALLGKPRIIIADEPTSALDLDAKEGFMELLFKQVEAQNSTLIFVSHDKTLASRFEKQHDFQEINRVVV